MEIRIIAPSNGRKKSQGSKQSSLINSIRFILRQDDTQLAMPNATKEISQHSPDSHEEFSLSKQELQQRKATVFPS